MRRPGSVSPVCSYRCQFTKHEATWVCHSCLQLLKAVYRHEKTWLSQSSLQFADVSIQTWGLLVKSVHPICSYRCQFIDMIRLGLVSPVSLQTYEATRLCQFCLHVLMSVYRDEADLTLSVLCAATDVSLQTWYDLALSVRSAATNASLQAWGDLAKSVTYWCQFTGMRRPGPVGPVCHSSIQLLVKVEIKVMFVLSNTSMLLVARNLLCVFYMHLNTLQAQWSRGEFPQLYRVWRQAWFVLVPGVHSHKPDSGCLELTFTAFSLILLVF